MTINKLLITPENIPDNVQEDIRDAIYQYLAKEYGNQVKRFDFDIYAEVEL